jgi:hypothetical protein
VALLLCGLQQAPFLLLLEVQQDSSLTDNLSTFNDGTHDDGAWSSQGSASDDTGPSHSGPSQRAQHKQPLHLAKQQQRASHFSVNAFDCTAADGTDASTAAVAMPVASSGKTESYLSSDCTSDLPNAADDFDTESQQQQEQEQEQQQELTKSRSEKAFLRIEQQEQDWSKPNQQQQQQQQQQEQQQELQRQHTPLELQMHEAAAILRGEKLVRLHLKVLDHCGSWQQQQQQQAMQVKAADDLHQQLALTEQGDASDALWLFGEVPATSSTDNLARAVSAAFHNGGVSPWSAQTTVPGCEQQAQQAVHVVLEVLAGPPAVPQLSKANGAFRMRRRLPSQEAIDIIAGGSCWQDCSWNLAG